MLANLISLMLIFFVRKGQFGGNLVASIFYFKWLALAMDEDISEP